ncbi:EpsG family protein [Mucilaginibacter jinjuensis]|uniref:EpsG family protein n=1 Tax=Mucilaginibacter jinjuensis TaxID=1176721 RepID=A0ABY7TC10_9SPHI|nr:EpsG family protein [Mucilaginibacter jinjuensis]WCT13167.1 EpsG family protein [Mucilaginibacter jinjuensis]
MIIYCIFFFITCLTAVLIKYGSLTSAKLTEYIWFFILVLFVGLRKDVGTDYPAYEQIYTEISSFGDTSYSVEPGYFFINQLVAFFHGDFLWVTLITAFISAAFLFKAINFFLNRDEKGIGYIVFISIGVFFVYYFSGIRQGVTISIFLFAIKYIIERRLTYYLFFLLLGSLFHTSILFFIPLYWVSSVPFRRDLIFIGSIVSLILARVGITALIFGYIIDLFTGGHYMGYKDLFSGGANTKTGLGVILRILIGLSLVGLSKTWIKNTAHIILYNMFAIGVILYCFFLGVDILNRISEYLTDLMIFIIPISFSSFNYKSKIIYGIIVLFILIALYYSNLNFDGMNIVPYHVR